MPALAALLWLAACGTAKAPDPVAGPVPAFRDTAAPIASSLRGAASDLNGDWVIAAAYPGGPVRAGTRMTLDLDAEGGMARISEDGAARLVPVTAQGRGRYEADGIPWWLLWTDDGFRTAAIGAPDGTHGWIMHRPGQAAADRTRAAREMLDFNGYDTGALEAATGG
nr:lipocalin family protein [Limimaricola litoreus]